jgi:hypothetical protein
MNQKGRDLKLEHLPLNTPNPTRKNIKSKQSVIKAVSGLHMH